LEITIKVTCFNPGCDVFITTTLEEFDSTTCKNIIKQLSIEVMNIMNNRELDNKKEEQ
tara:strand:- start:732 stop:905 length:174 start_codon:yes stop_codon:yes gene_type:complete